MSPDDRGRRRPKNCSYKRKIWAYKNADFKKLSCFIENWLDQKHQQRLNYNPYLNSLHVFVNIYPNKLLPVILAISHGLTLCYAKQLESESVSETKYSKPKRIPIGPFIERTEIQSTIRMNMRYQTTTIISKPTWKIQVKIIMFYWRLIKDSFNIKIPYEVPQIYTSWSRYKKRGIVRLCQDWDN